VAPRHGARRRVEGRRCRGRRRPGRRPLAGRGQGCVVRPGDPGIGHEGRRGGRVLAGASVADRAVPRRRHRLGRRHRFEGGRMSTIWLVAKREFRVRALSKANVITSLIMLAIIVGGAFVGRVFLGGGEAVTEVVHVDRAAVSELMPYLEASAAQREAPLEFVAVDTPAEPALAEGVVAIIGGSAGQPEGFLEDERGDIVEITAAAASAYVLDREISGLGGDPAEVGQALAQAVPTVTLLGDADELDPGSFFAGAMVIIALLFILIQSASVIMMGVVEEK